MVEPHHSGIGGGCFSLLYDAKTGKTEGIDGRGIAPAKATADLFIKDGEVQDEWKDLGGQSVALPGLLKTMDIVLKKYGTMTLKDVAAPAIRCARNGFGTSYTGALTMYDNSVERKMRLSEAFRKLYLKEDGSFYRFGEIQKMGVSIDSVRSRRTRRLLIFWRILRNRELIISIKEKLQNRL